MLRLFLTLFFACLMSAQTALAQRAVEKILPLDGRVSADGAQIELNWFDATPKRVGSVSINRRPYGRVGGESWKPLASALGPVMRYADDAVRPGLAYEYQVLRTGRDIVDAGYWLAGTKIPAVAFPGNVYVIADETLAEPIAPRLKRFVRDLTADGWRVSRLNIPRGDKAAPKDGLKGALTVKAWLREQYQGDPFGKHVIILVGHVPIIKSGKAKPDGHDANPHATDLFYADMNGRWQINSEGELLHNRLPDGSIEMQVGRIDFRNVSDGDPERELHLLRSYFDKNHHWRTRMTGPLSNAYAQNDHLTVERAGLRNIVGPGAVVTGGHHDAGEREPWLWGVDFGSWKGRNYAKPNANKAVFAINFGSGKQQIGGTFNPMNAMLAQPWYTLAVGWGARPAWWLHHMALGGTIGDVHMRTVNNGSGQMPYRDSLDYFPTGNYLWRNPIWVNLLGDPTLRAFVMAPPRAAATRQRGQTVELSWAASEDPDTQGYRIYRAPADSDRFTEVDSGNLVTGLSFTDRDPVEDAVYMIRAYGLKQVHAGSFYAYSQGVFVSPTATPETDPAPALTLEAQPGQPVALPTEFNRATEEKITAIITPPATGKIIWAEGRWQYTPPDDFTGEVDIRYSVSGSLQTQTARLVISVGPQ